MSTDGSSRWSESEAQVVLGEWAASGLEAEAFCRLRGLHPRRLRRWQERLQPIPLPEPLHFVEVVVANPPTPPLSVRLGRVLADEGVHFLGLSIRALRAWRGRRAC